MRTAAALCLLMLLTATAAGQERVERSITVPPLPDDAPSRVASRRQQPTPEPAADEPGVPGPIIDAPHEILDDTFEYEYDYGSPCDLGCTQCGGLGCDLFWLRAEYLLYWAEGMDVPPLVTRSPPGTLRDDAGVLGVPGTEILYGGGILRDERHGGRFTGGLWLDNCRRFGGEVEYFFLGEISERYRAGSNEGTIIARPFFNALDGVEDAQLVRFPNVLDGAVTVTSTSFIQGAGARFLWNVMENFHCPIDGCGHVSCGGALTRFDVILGYRYMNLDEQLWINEDLVVLESANLGALFNINDIFDTNNDFHGGELGLQWSMMRNRWILTLLGKVALGNTHQQVRIRGNTLITANGQTNDFAGGLLAQLTNIGDYSNDEFSTLTELGTTLKYQVGCHLYLTAGYTVIFWDNVVRPGRQIDRAVNENLLAPPNLPLVGPARPRFRFHDESFWLQGLRLGAEWRW